MGELSRWLGSDAGLGAWWDRQQPLGGSPVALPEPTPEELLELAVPHEDIGPLLTAAAAAGAEPAAGRLVERCARLLRREVGTVGRPPLQLPVLPAALGPFASYFPVLVHLAVLPATRAFHAERRIPAEVTRLTLTDLGRTMALHRRRYGQGGMLHPYWLAHHVRGELYQLGRLQFQRARLGSRTGLAVAGAGAPYGPGSPCLGVHIPDFCGPLTPAACDRSVAWAREFFTRHFPAEYPADRPTVATCHSWLLDPQLREYLPGDANLIRFQRRFRPGYRPEEPEDTVAVDFVFGDPTLTLTALPRRTTLERAIGDHLRAGRHWYGGNGWFEL
ncbi:acyltransferase domain-containing protein [Kitasatospora sp. LaBMicrA B282]|uniref:acyltransferase domain-containing protein n=1 Tax=Kitasatospora sp. LaBMicrA B282 TaxID=3420949 RepID=UPI003D0C8EFE